MSDMPRLTLSQESIDYLHQDLPVAEARFLIVPEDWERFADLAYEGMIIPVRLEGQRGHSLEAVLVSIDPGDHSITVVI